MISLRIRQLAVLWSAGLVFEGDVVVSNRKESVVCCAVGAWQKVVALAELVCLRVSEPDSPEFEIPKSVDDPHWRGVRTSNP